VAARQRLLLDAEAEANAVCQRARARKSRQRREHAGRVSELVEVVQRLRRNVASAEAELPPLVADVFRN
jgi:hypothetical protein